MTNATAPMPAMRGMTDGELAALYDAGDADTVTAVLAECKRRDDAQRVAPARDALARLHAEWYDAAYADYLAAEAACVGYFVRPEYAAKITEPFRLWSAGNDEWAQSRATRELLDWWIDHPRLTFARWQKMRRDAVRIAGEEAASLTETGNWEVPAAWAAETTEVTTDGHDPERAEVDGPPQAGHGRGSAASAVRPGRDRQQHAGAEAGRMRDAGSVQSRRGGVMDGAATYTPGCYAAAIVTGGKRRIIARDIPALEQAQDLLRPPKRRGRWKLSGSRWNGPRSGRECCGRVIPRACSSSPMRRPQGGRWRSGTAALSTSRYPPIPGRSAARPDAAVDRHLRPFPSAAALDVVTLWDACTRTPRQSRQARVPRLAAPVPAQQRPGIGKSAVLELLDMSARRLTGWTLEPDRGQGLVKSTKSREHA